MSGVASVPTRSTPAQPAPGTAGRVRADIQGLRAVAVSLVLLYHLWPLRLTGGYVGVDVFFVISGFLITAHLLAAPPAGLRDLLVFWSRRVRRLLPASLLVLACTAAATWAFAPQTQWGNVADQVRAAALYYVNWALASDSVDYLAAENAPSPVQHFWSLSVEEQFYLGWPIVVALLFALAAVVRRRGPAARPVIIAGLGVVVAASLAWSVWLTHVSPASAYFNTFTRIWELGAGGLLAAALSQRAFGRQVGEHEGLPLPDGVRTVLSWAGFAAMAVAALVYTSATPFPGWTAALPVLGAVLVLAADAPQRGLSPTRVLSTRPVQWLGDVSYSVYLWHWPLIVLVPSVTDRPLERLDKLLILAATLVLAGLTKAYVEDRFRTPRWGRPLVKPYALGVAGMAVVVALALALGAAFTQAQEDAERQLAERIGSGDPCFGAAALDRDDCAPVPGDEIVPAPAQALEDKSDAYGRGCWEYVPFGGMRTCAFGVRRSETTVALVGNSHAGQWLPALQELARAERFRIETYLASECTPSTTPVEFDTVADADGCLGWAQRVQQELLDDPPDLLVLSARNGRAARGLAYDDSLERWRAGYTEFLAPLVDAGVRVLTIHDTPFPASTVGSIPDCLAANLDDLTACDGRARDWVPPDPLVEATESFERRTARTVDLTDRFCRRGTCPAVIGGVVVYFDGSHVTATYNATVAPYLRSALLTALDR